MAFPDIQTYKGHLRTYAVLQSMDYVVKKSDKTRLCVVCKNQKSILCKWQVNARKFPSETTITIRQCNLDHNDKCTFDGGYRNQKCNARFVADFLLRTMDPSSKVPKADHILKNIIMPKLNTEIPYWVTNDARNLVLAHFNGSFEQSYIKVPQLWKASKTLSSCHNSEPKQYRPLHKGEGRRITNI